MIRFTLRTVLLAVAFLVVGAIVAPLLPAAALAAVSRVQPSLPRLVFANLLTAAVLLFLLARTPGGFVPRARLAGLLLAGLQLNNLLELLIFDVGIPRAQLPWFFVHGAVSGALCGLIAAAVSGAGEAGAAARGAWTTPWRFAAIVASYVVVYFTAGLAIFPFIVDFYEPWRLPSHFTMLPMSILRGSVFAALAFLIVRSLRASRWAAALGVALALAIIGGVAPLIPENPYLPGFVRYAHMVEVGVSNVLFGAFAGWLLWRDETMPA